MACFDYEELQAQFVKQRRERGRSTDGKWAFEPWWLRFSSDNVPADVAQRLWVARGYRPGAGLPLIRLC